MVEIKDWFGFLKYRKYRYEQHGWKYPENPPPIYAPTPPHKQHHLTDAFFFPFLKNLNCMWRDSNFRLRKKCSYSQVVHRPARAVYLHKRNAPHPIIGLFSVDISIAGFIFLRRRLVLSPRSPERHTLHWPISCPYYVWLRPLLGPSAFYQHTRRRVCDLMLRFRLCAHSHVEQSFQNACFWYLFSGLS